MKILVITLSLFLAPSAWAQSYICKPVFGCILPEGECVLPPDNTIIANIKISEKAITFIEPGFEDDSMEILSVIKGVGKTSYFGVSNSEPGILTVFENGSIFIFSSFTEGVPSALVAELSCEVQ